MATDCVFCMIISGKIPSAKVYEDAHSLAFLDIMPVHKGHLLVVPKKHYAVMTDMPDKELQQLITAVNVCAKAINKSIGPDGTNIAENNGEAAGQSVHHVHFHIIPRYKTDTFGFDWPMTKYSDNAEMADTAAKIKNGFA